MGQLKIVVPLLLFFLVAPVRSQQEAVTKPSTGIVLPTATPTTTASSAAATPILTPSSSVAPEAPEAEPTSVEQRKAAIVKMAREAWNWHTANNWTRDSAGHTTVGSLSTLWVMDLKDEFQRAKEWVAANLTEQFELEAGKEACKSVHEYVGALLSSYALTGEQLFLDKAKQISDRLNSSYDAVWDRPNITSGQEKRLRAKYEWARQYLEYAYLSNLTSDPAYLARLAPIDAYFDAAFEASPKLKNSTKLFGYLISYQLHIKVKAYLQSPDSPLAQKYLDSYREMVDAAQRNRMIQETVSGFTIVHTAKVNVFFDIDCHLGAVLRLGADAIQQSMDRNASLDEATLKKGAEDVKKHRELAEKITETCHIITEGSKSGLPPENTRIDVKAANVSDTFVRIGDYLLGPHLAKSYLVLYRKTGDPKYREWAWQLAQAIARNTKTEAGFYSTVDETQVLPTVKKGLQPPIFLGATLKYLYLIFSDNSVLPLDKWVFTSAGHPLPAPLK